MRTRGLQWVEYKAKWGSKHDEDVGTVPELTNHLKEIIREKEATARRWRAAQLRACAHNEAQDLQAAGLVDGAGCFRLQIRSRVG